MAAGKRPVPSRTRKLSPPAPMVLPGGPGGRVGHRRAHSKKLAPDHRSGANFVFRANVFCADGQECSKAFARASTYAVYGFWRSTSTQELSMTLSAASKARQASGHIS